MTSEPVPIAPDVRTSVRIEAPPDVVFDFLVDADKLVRWMGTDPSADGDATVVELTHGGLPVGQDESHLEGWLHYLARLAIAGTGRDPGADPMTQRSGSTQ